MNKIVLQVIVILLGLTIINLILGTAEINHIWDSNIFICNMKIPSSSDICDKKFGFFFWYLIYSIPLLSSVVGLIVKNTHQALLAPVSIVTLWGMLLELISRLLSIPTLYSWERSSLHYGFFSVFPAWWEFIGLPLLIVLGIVTLFGLSGFYVKNLVFLIRRKLY